MSNYIRFTIVCFLLLGCSSAVSADIDIKASVDKNKISQDETVTLSIVITSNMNYLPKIQLSDLKEDFEILSTAQSQDISLKGRQTNLVVNFQYILLPKKYGKLTIKPIEAGYKGKVYKTEPIDIEVSRSQKPIIPQQESPPEEKVQETIL
ncbi:MAG: BatD family protein [Candidatus Omnitrophota bacterium]